MTEQLRDMDLAQRASEAAMECETLGFSATARALRLLADQYRMSSSRNGFPAEQPSYFCATG